jgi:hypothetical protein
MTYKPGIVSEQAGVERARYSAEILKVQWKRGGSDGGPSMRRSCSRFCHISKNNFTCCDLLTFFLHEWLAGLGCKSSKHSSRQQQAKFFLMASGSEEAATMILPRNKRQISHTNFELSLQYPESRHTIATHIGVFHFAVDHLIYSTRSGHGNKAASPPANRHRDPDLDHMQQFPTTTTTRQPTGDR